MKMEPSVILLIDELGPGGAERQICMLALELARKGYPVQIVCYYPNTWYQKYLLGDSVPVRLISWRNKIEKIWKVYRFLRKQKDNIVISFLEGANMLNILSRFPFKSKLSKIVISERFTYSYPFPLIRKIYLFFYKLADAIVVNSYSELKSLTEHAAFLSDKIRLIPNCVDLKKFRPATQEGIQKRGRLVFGVFASYSERKRPLDLIIAVEKIVEKIGKNTPYFVWYGENKDVVSGKIYKEFERATRMISERGLGDFFDLRGPTPTPEEALRTLDCVCLTSEKEGLPNSICEAFASGKPVVATRVGDVPYLVTEEKNGFLAEPRSPDSLASALMKMILLDEQKRIEMGRVARLYAEQNFSIERFSNQYLDIINK